MVHSVGSILRIEKKDLKTGIRTIVADGEVGKVTKFYDDHKVSSVTYHFVSIMPLVREEDMKECMIPREINNKDSEWFVVNPRTIKAMSRFFR